MAFGEYRRDPYGSPEGDLGHRVPCCGNEDDGVQDK